MTNPHNPHRPIHDRWMVNPNDPDYLSPADRWCVLCALDDSDPIHVHPITDETIAQRPETIAERLGRSGVSRSPY